jgi:hypothetical protein
MSIHFINYKIIMPIGYSVKSNIVKEIHICKYFSIMINSTQDIRVIDQLAVCLRDIVNDSNTRKIIYFSCSQGFQ